MLVPSAFWTRYGVWMPASVKSMIFAPPSPSWSCPEAVSRSRVGFRCAS